MLTADVLKIFLPAAGAFLVGIALAPLLSHFLYRNRLWKQRGGKTALDGTEATVFNGLHKEKEVGTPRFGGIVVWGSVLLTAAAFSILSYVFGGVFEELSFISRSQTWVPLAAFFTGAFVGLLDDFFEVRRGRGLRLRWRLLVVTAVATLCALWFYQKLGVSSVNLPFIDHPLELGLLFIPFFILVALFIYAGGVIDGIDGLAGGVFATAFIAYAGVAFIEQELDLAALSAAIAGALLAFTWFNVPPARFYLSETGTMGLTLVLTVIAFLTDAHGGGKGVAALPVIALPLVVTVLSNVAQITSKKVFGRKLLRIAPLHHHFEAIGWPSYKVTMRYWIVAIIAALIGISVAIL